LVINPRFGRTCSFHLHGRRVSEARSSVCYLLRAGFLLVSRLRKPHVPPKRLAAQSAENGAQKHTCSFETLVPVYQIHGVISKILKHNEQICHCSNDIRSRPRSKSVKLIEKGQRSQKAEERPRSMATTHPVCVMQAVCIAVVIT
jgi:hypothetical protein